MSRPVAFVLGAVLFLGGLWLLAMNFTTSSAASAVGLAALIVGGLLILWAVAARSDRGSRQSNGNGKV